MPENAVPSQRRGVDLVVAVLGIVAILWGGYWYLANQLTELALRRVLASVATDGRTAGCVPAGTARSPLRLDVGCRALTFADRASGLSVDLGGVSLRVPLYWPLRVEADAAGPLSFATADGGATAKWSGADLSADAGWGGLKRVTFTVRDADFAGDLVGRLDLAGVTVPAFDVAVEPAANGAYIVAAKSDGIRPAAESGRDLPEIDFRLKVAGNKFGSALGLDPRRAFRKWIARGGETDLDELSVTAGGLDARATGKLTVSGDGRLSGKVSLRIKGLAALPDLAEAYRPGTRDQAEKVRKILTAVTRDAKAPEGGVRTTTLTLRDSVVAFGLVPLAVIPPLF